MNQLLPLTIKGQCIAEFIGTSLMVFLGISCIAAMKLTDASFGQWEISIVWGMSVAIAIYLTASISGAHLNPSVTIALWLFTNFDKHKVLPYIISQIFGAFFAAALVYLLYYNLFFQYEQVNNIIRSSINSLDSASVFSTYPNKEISIFKACLVEIIITTILLFIILALTDDNNKFINKKLAPLLIGIIIAIIGSSIGPLTGFALNPARDLGPKTFAFLAGWGKIAYTGNREIPYFLIPLIAPTLGACLGAFSYRSFIIPYLPNKKLSNIRNI